VLSHQQRVMFSHNLSTVILGLGPGIQLLNGKFWANRSWIPSYAGMTKKSVQSPALAIFRCFYSLGVRSGLNFPVEAFPLPHSIWGRGGREADGEGDCVEDTPSPPFGHLSPK
jgi:hypothetical protein